MSAGADDDAAVRRRRAAASVNVHAAARTADGVTGAQDDEPFTDVEIRDLSVYDRLGEVS